jgi:hypothetical protein
MKLLLTLWIAFATWAPTFAFAEEAISGGYRGIASIYYTLMWAILCYGLYDSYGKKAAYIGGPLLGLMLYLLLPST